MARVSAKLLFSEIPTDFFVVLFNCFLPTKINANASRHGALSHGHIEQLEIQLKAVCRSAFATDG